MKKDPWIGKTVKVTQCLCFAEEFKHIKPGCECIVINPPKGKTNKETAVWVQGVKKPIQLIACEFKFIKTKVRRTK